VNTNLTDVESNRASRSEMGATKASLLSRLRSFAAPSRSGAIYVLVVAVIIFSIDQPRTFPHWATVQQVLTTNAVTALAALALIIPLTAGVFDISVPYTMSLSGIITTHCIVQLGQPVALALAIGIAVSVLVGLLNGLVVVVAKIDALIGTLATGFLIQAVITWRSKGVTISGFRLGGVFSDISQTKWLFGLTLPALYALILSLAIWYVLQHTAMGRRLYATGFAADAARLAGVRTNRIRFGSLIVSSTLAGITGIVLASTLGSGSPSAGNGYLLPAFAAVFLGATQFFPGFFNAWGTIAAVILLGTLITGLALAGAAEWVQEFTTGVVLIAALALTGFEVRSAGSGRERNAVIRRVTGLLRPKE
jgi:ribose transport system permease protein